MKSSFFLLLVVQVGLVAAGIHRRASKCDVGHACSIIESLSTGAAFCSSLLWLNGVSTKTKTKTTTITVSDECSTKTKTQTVHIPTFTSTEYGKTTTLPTITKTEYSTSVLIPSGPSPTINKRTATPANQVTTPKALTTCDSQTLSSACSSLYPTVTTITQTATKTTYCTTTTTLTTTTYDHTTITKIPFLVSPPPIIISATGTLTTTVPAACAASPYNPNGNGQGNEIIPVDYPVFAQTGVECCVACFAQTNCVASAVIITDGQVVECDFLVHTNGTAAGVSNICPLGIQDYPFGTPQADGNVYPGPCGT